MSLSELKAELELAKDPEKAGIHSRFFKTGKGEYGEGSIFLGIKVPILREIAKRYFDLNFNELQELLNDKIHTYRFVALVILVEEYKKGNKEKKKEIYDFYLKNFKNINNWDLVDVSCPQIVGDYLINKDRSILYDFANSDHLWTKRIAIISTFAFIRNNQLDDTINISEILLNDDHDLIHKACGWMLREVGKRDQKVLEKFLDKHVKEIPRTMLRYSIEKFEEEKRKYYLNK
jgi:3-methyladenine DNA glycosylase AlkD